MKTIQEVNAALPMGVNAIESSPCLLELHSKFIAHGYESLTYVLMRAFEQASNGKGAERHANQLPFDKQPMQTVASQVGVGFLLGQAIKKTQESQGMPAARAVAELLGAINYLAGAVIFLEGQAVPAANDNIRICVCGSNVDGVPLPCREHPHG